MLPPGQVQEQLQVQEQEQVQVQEQEQVQVQEQEQEQSKNCMEQPAQYRQRVQRVSANGSFLRHTQKSKC